MRLQTIALVAHREIVERVRSRAFLVATAILLAGVALAASVPQLLKDSKPTYELGVAGSSVTATVAAVPEVAREAGAAVYVHRVAAADVPTALKDGTLDAVLVDGRRLVVRGEPAATLQAIVQSAAVAAHTQPGATRIELTHLDGGGSATARSVAVGAAILLYVALILAANWVATGVVEEKSSRIVELMLAAIRPGEMLVGKLVGIGLVVLGQVAAAVAASVAAGTATGSFDLPHGVAGTALGVVGWFLLGYALFACLFAAAAALVSRQEDVPAVTTPLNVVLASGFLVAMTAAQHPDGALAQVMSIAPPFSPLLMPVRLAAGDVPVWQPLLAVPLALVAIGLAIWVAGRLYSRSVLHAGGRLSLRAALGGGRD